MTALNANARSTATKGGRNRNLYDLNYNVYNIQPVFPAIAA